MGGIIWDRGTQSHTYKSSYTKMSLKERRSSGRKKHTHTRTHTTNVSPEITSNILIRHSKNISFNFSFYE